MSGWVRWRPPHAVGGPPSVEGDIGSSRKKTPAEWRENCQALSCVKCAVEYCCFWNQTCVRGKFIGVRQPDLCACWVQSPTWLAIWDGAVEVGETSGAMACVEFNLFRNMFGWWHVCACFLKDQGATSSEYPFKPFRRADGSYGTCGASACNF